MCRRTDYEFPCSHVESRIRLCSYRCYLVKHRERRRNQNCEMKVELFEEPTVDIIVSNMYFKSSVIWVGAGLAIRKKERVVDRLRIRYEEECEECCV